MQHRSLLPIAIVTLGLSGLFGHPTGLCQNSPIVEDKLEATNAIQLYAQSRILLEQLDGMKMKSDASNADMDQVRKKLVEILANIDPTKIPKKTLITEDQALANVMQTLPKSSHALVSKHSIEYLGGLVLVKLNRDLPEGTRGSDSLGHYTLDGYTGTIIFILTGA